MERASPTSIPRSRTCFPAMFGKVVNPASVQIILSKPTLLTPVDHRHLALPDQDRLRLVMELRIRHFPKCVAHREGRNAAHSDSRLWTRVEPVAFQVQSPQAVARALSSITLKLRPAVSGRSSDTIRQTRAAPRPSIMPISNPPIPAAATGTTYGARLPKPRPTM